VSLGSFFLKCRLTYGHGLRVHRYRDRLRPRILGTPPIEEIGRDSAAEIHVLTREDDWLNLVWTLKSFYLVTDRRYPLCVHDDGTMSPEATAQLRAHFPGMRLIETGRSDEEVVAVLEDYPLCQVFRRQFKLARKVFDFIHYLDNERMLLIDSDVLFFKPPEVLLQRIEDPTYRCNSLNRDISTAYTVDAATVRDYLNIEMEERINSGLGLIHRDSMPFSRIEDLLTVPGVIGHYWRIEQTLYALCGMLHGYEALPPEYDVYRGPGLGNRASRHYVGEIRLLFYKEGIARLLDDGAITLPA
jgi:hypothetical protein